MRAPQRWRYLVAVVAMICLPGAVVPRTGAFSRSAPHPPLSLGVVADRAVDVEARVTIWSLASGHGTMAGWSISRVAYKTLWTPAADKSSARRSRAAHTSLPPPVDG